MIAVGEGDLVMGLNRKKDVVLVEEVGIGSLIFM
jgi:hypothetical protein